MAIWVWVLGTVPGSFVASGASVVYAGASSWMILAVTSPGQAVTVGVGGRIADDSGRDGCWVAAGVVCVRLGQRTSGRGQLIKPQALQGWTGAVWSARQAWRMGSRTTHHLLRLYFRGGASASTCGDLGAG